MIRNTSDVKEKIRKCFLNPEHPWGKRLTAALCGVIVFTTTCSLIMPASALASEQQTGSGENADHEFVQETSTEEPVYDTDDFCVDTAETMTETTLETEITVETESNTLIETETAVESDHDTFMKTEINAEGAAFDKKVPVAGADYSLRVSGTADCGIPEDAVFKAAVIKEDASAYQDFSDAAQRAAAKENDELSSEDCRTLALFDLSIYDGDGIEIQPEAPISVKIQLDSATADEAGEAVALYAVHFAGTSLSEDGEVVDAETTKKIAADSVDTEVISIEETGGAVSFDAESFSVYALVYTVDFGYEVDGRSYEFSIPGGGFVSFYDLVESLGIASDEAGISDLVKGVEGIRFSEPELVSVSKVKEDTTVGAIKERLDLECVYSAELTEEEIAKINSQKVRAGDWALISLKPFAGEEILTVTMRNGDKFTVKVSDAQAALPSTAPPDTSAYVYNYAESSIMDNANVQQLIGSANQWQIVSGKYVDNSEEYKTTASNGRVRVQKNVIPTDTENEFLVYLSVDINRDSILQEIFETVGIVHTPSNDVPNYGQYWSGGQADNADECWETGKSKGNMRPFTTRWIDGTSRYTWKIHITAGGKTYTITRYAEDGSFNQGHILMKIAGKWMTVGDAAKTVGNARDLYVDIDNGALDHLLKDVTNVEIGNVTDHMGPGITAEDIIAYKPSGGENAASISEDGKTINWKIVASTMGYTTDSWYPNIAELVYKIKYVPEVSTGLTSGAQTVADHPAANVDTNSSAVLTYKVITGSGSSSGTQEFPKPVIRGMLYEIKGVKFAGDVSGDSTGEPLPGAVFTLYSDPDFSNVVATSETNNDGVFDFTGLQYGTYYLRETTVPTGYSKVADQEIRLCYTSDYAGLTGQGAGEEALYRPEGEREYSLTDPENIVKVTKTVQVTGDDIELADVEDTIYIVLKKHGTEEYVTDTDGNILCETISIRRGLPNPESVTFYGVETGLYDVLELAEAPLPGSTEVKVLTEGRRITTSGGKKIQLASIEGTCIYVGSDGSIVSTTGNNADLRYGNTAEVDFTNIYSKQATIDKTVIKKWLSEKNSENPPAGAKVTFTLYRKAGSEGTIEEVPGVSPIELDGTVDGTPETGGELTAWQATFVGLDVEDENGQTYIYLARETVCPPEYAPYASSSDQMPMGEGDYLDLTSANTITNKQKTTQITIKKEDSAGAFLPGATFQLFRVQTNAEGTVQESSVGKAFTISEESGVTIDGLYSGTYKLTEISAPAGYVITVDSITFYVDATGDGPMITFDVERPVNVKEDPTQTDAEGDTITIVNTPGAVLPNTGGPGTKLFTILGAFLIAGAGFLMWRKHITE